MGDKYAESRAYKASKLAASLRQRGVTPDRAVRLRDVERRYAEKLAGVRKASDETWLQVFDMLSGSAGPGGLCPFCWHGDPQGSPGPRKPFGHTGPCASDPPPRQ
jgi:hypothetical protein